MKMTMKSFLSSIREKILKALTEGCQFSSRFAVVISGFLWRGSSLVAGSITIDELDFVISLIITAKSYQYNTTQSKEIPHNNKRTGHLITMTTTTTKERREMKREAEEEYSP